MNAAELARLQGLVSRGRNAEAVEGLAALVEANPKEVVPSFLLGRALRAMGQGARSRAVFEAIAAHAPDDPHVALGLAWIRIDARDIHGAAELASKATGVAPLRGDALAIQARSQEAHGEKEKAAALFLDAYEAKPLVPWLEAAWTLSDRDEPPELKPAPDWPIGPAERLSLFRSVERELVARGQRSGRNLDAHQVLTAGCDNTSRFTRAWAKRRFIDQLDLYFALAGRGGYCDCEVILNAARESDETLASILVAGRIQGRVRAMQELVSRTPTPDLPWLATHAEHDIKSEETLSVEADGSAIRVLPQLADGKLIEEIVDALGDPAMGDTTVMLLLLYPDLPGEDELLMATEGKLEPVALSGDKLSPAVLKAAPWATSELAALRKAWPVPREPLGAGQLELPPPGHLPALVYRSDGVYRAVSAKDGRETLLGRAGSSLVFDADRAVAAWLEPYRRQSDLVVERRSVGKRERVATEPFRGPLNLSPDGRLLYLASGNRIVAFDLASSERRVLGLGSQCTLAPDGEHLLIESDSNLWIVDPGGKIEVPEIEGRLAVWSPRSDRITYLAKVDGGEGYQAFVLDLKSGQSRRVSPACEEACWPTFTKDGDAVAVYIRRATHRTPLADGKTKIEQDESLLLVDISEPDRPETLFASDRGYMAITRPVAHPARAIVAFQTQSAPQRDRRLVVVEPGATLRTLVDADVRPTFWL